MAMREILHLLPKPSHYAGMEDGTCRKNPDDVKLRIALAFPDAYEVGMSYLGQKILYSIVNARPEWEAGRVMAPDPEAAAIMREHGVHLATLESDTPLSQLAAICFSVTHELCYTDVLHMLDLGAIPLRHADRPDDLTECPVIMAGGGAMLGAEPLTPFLDLVALGDGEELLPDILELLQTAREKKLGRKHFLELASAIPGVYVPSLFVDTPDGGLQPLKPGYRPKRRIVADLDSCPYPEKQVAPVGAVHNRLSLEIARGCTRGCRFCHAGVIYRPVRERKPETVSALLDSCLRNTGFDEVSFLALSAGDCTALKTIYKAAIDRCHREQTTLALPSLRVGSVDDEIMAGMAELRRPGCTLAPEAGSQRLRDVINKGVTESDLILHTRKLLEHGWRHIKLYFMIGLPTETDEDLDAIVDLARKARDAGGPGAPRVQITVAVSPFVPKPFTPFQWEGQIGLDEISRRINFLRDKIKSVKSVQLKWHAPQVSHLEGVLSRGGRNLADVVEKAYRNGAIFCSWTEHFDLMPWLEAFAECGIKPQDCIRARDANEVLPWDHIEAGISRKFLLRERDRAYAGKTTPDCRSGACSQCGACDTTASPTLLACSEKAGHRLVFAQRDQNAHEAPEDENGRLLLRATKSERPRLDAALTVKAAQYRLWHVKTGACAYLSQLELQALLTRALRRAQAPVAFSQGFHPLPLLSFGRAMPVGADSEAEWFGLVLHSRLAPARLAASLNEVLPEGLAVGHVELIASKRVEMSISEVFALDVPDSDMLETTRCFADFSEKKSHVITRITRKGEKDIEIRPFLLNWKISLPGSGGSRIVFATDWSCGYLSPVALVRAVLEPLGKIPGRLAKISQTFANGAEYAATGRK